jgi:quinoprotein glucose dehydrogenase
LKQINKSNVKQLEVAWTCRWRRDGAVQPDRRGQRDGVLGANRSIVAIDARPAEVWTHRNEGAVGAGRINYWESKDRSERRLL